MMENGSQVVSDYEEAIIANGWGDEIAIKYFPTFLAWAAKDWYFTDVRPEGLTKWVHVRRLFEMNFLGESDAKQLTRKHTLEVTRV